MSQYEPMREVSRDDLISEVNKIALREVRDDSSNSGNPLGGDVDSHCVDFDEKECSPFRWDCTCENARLCAGSKGVVELKVSSHGCNGGCHEEDGGQDLSYSWEWSKEKDSGYKPLNGQTNSLLEFRLNMISWEPESGDTVWIKAVSECADHPKNKKIEGGSGAAGNSPIKVRIVDCCDGDKPCKEIDKYCCNKQDHPNQPEGCQTCCKDNHCPDGKECIDGTCKEKDEGPEDECTKDGDCTQGKKTKCCTKNGKKVCLECCGNGDCPDGKCEDGVCVPNENPDPDPEPEDPCKDVECPEGEICEDGKCVEDPDYDPCKDVECPGASKCVDGECVCDDENAIIIGDVCVCDNGYEWDEDEEKCVANGDSKPPVGEDPCGNPDDKCHGVICTPPMECDPETGDCVCPEGTELINGLCLDPDKCKGVLCPPNAKCEDGVCVCEEGYVADPKGNCVMAETPGCEPPEDCCPANSTICVQAGSGLGGGGCFTLNQDCDKTIMLWVDPNHETADDDCDPHGMQQICACTKEIQMLTDMITSLTARIAELEMNQGKVDGEEPTEGGYYQNGVWVPG